MSKLRVHNLVVSLDGFAQVPVVLGRGVRLWDGLEGLQERYTLETLTVPSGATHLFFTR